MSGEMCHTFCGQWLPKIRIDISIFFHVYIQNTNDRPHGGHLVMFRMYNNNYYYYNTIQYFYEILQAQQKIMTITITESILVKLSKVSLLSSCAQGTI